MNKKMMRLAFGAKCNPEDWICLASAFGASMLCSASEPTPADPACNSCRRVTTCLRNSLASFIFLDSIKATVVYGIIRELPKLKFPAAFLKRLTWEHSMSLHPAIDFNRSLITIFYMSISKPLRFSRLRKEFACLSPMISRFLGSHFSSRSKRIAIFAR
jgi:hypothetical protein